MDQDNQQIYEEILEAIELCRSHVLDTCQFELGESQNWPALRTRLLRAFGDRGLEARIRGIFTGFGLQIGDAHE